LGIACEFDERGLSRVRGFPGPVAEALSSPSRRIRDLAPDDSSKAKEEANLRQRQTKAELPLDEVAEACRRRAEELGFSAEDARKFLGVVSRENRPGELEATRHFLRGVVAGLSSEFTKAELFERTFREGARAGLPFAELYSAARETLEDPEAVEPLGRVGGKEKFRKLEGVEFLPGRDEMSRGFHEFLEQIIASTPELDVAEFLPPPPVQGGELVMSTPRGGFEDDRESTAAPEQIKDPGISREDIEAALGSLEAALHLQADAVEALLDAARLRTSRDAARELSSPDGASGDANQSIYADGKGTVRNPGTQAGGEPRPPEQRWLEASNLPEDTARSLFGRVVERARGMYVERLADAAVERAVGDLTGRNATFTLKDLTGAVGDSLAGRPVPYAVQDDRIADYLRDPERVVPLGSAGGVEHFTTPELFRAEAEGIRAAEALLGRSRHAEPEQAVRDRLATLPIGEREAVAKALSAGDLVIVEGGDGSQMQAVQRGLKEALNEGFLQRNVERLLGRKDVLWVAPTATAARELERSVGAEHVATLAKLVYNLDRGLGESALHHGKMVVNAALGRPTWDGRQLSLTSHSTVILDSASIADTRQFSRLLQHAEGAGARVIACGIHELPGLGPGGLFRELRDRADERRVVTLPEESKSRVEVIPTRDREEAKSTLIERWAAEAMGRPKDHSIVAASASDVRELNEMAQAERKRAGHLGFRSAEIRYQLGDRTVKERIYEGDRVVFTARTDRDVINGVFGTVKHIDLITGRMTVALDLKDKKYLPWEFDRQKTVTFQYRQYKFFQRREEGIRLGYAATVYRSQNVAVEGNSYCLLGGPGGATSAVYAGLNLAKGKSYFFGDDLERRAERAEPKLTAHAIMAEAERERQARELEQQRQREQAQDFGLGL
jgi:hypothetical protein